MKNSEFEIINPKGMKGLQCASAWSDSEIQNRRAAGANTFGFLISNFEYLPPFTNRHS